MKNVSSFSFLPKEHICYFNYTYCVFLLKMEFQLKIKEYTYFIGVKYTYFIGVKFAFFTIYAIAFNKHK